MSFRLRCHYAFLRLLHFAAFISMLSLIIFFSFLLFDYFDAAYISLSPLLLFDAAFAAALFR